MCFKQPPNHMGRSPVSALLPLLPTGPCARPSSTGTGRSSSGGQAPGTQGPSSSVFCYTTRPSPACSTETHGWCYNDTESLCLWGHELSTEQIGLGSMAHVRQRRSTELGWKSLPSIPSFISKLLLWPDHMEGLFPLLLHLCHHLLRTT